MLEEAALYERVAPDDPNACKGVNQHGPCPFKAIEGQKFCRIHFGIGNKALERTNARNYRLQKYQHRLETFADNDALKSLREEVAILRMLLEEIINRCESATDLLIHSSRISELVMKVEKLVVSCHKLEAATGSLLDRATVLQLGDIIINVVAKIIPADKLEVVSAEIIDSIQGIGKLTEIRDESAA